MHALMHFHLHLALTSMMATKQSITAESGIQSAHFMMRSNSPKLPFQENK